MQYRKYDCPSREFYDILAYSFSQMISVLDQGSVVLNVCFLLLVNFIAVKRRKFRFLRYESLNFISMPDVLYVQIFLTFIQ